MGFGETRWSETATRSVCCTANKLTIQPTTCFACLNRIFHTSCRLIHIVYSHAHFPSIKTTTEFTCSLPPRQPEAFRSVMENPDWDFVLQFVSEPSEMDIGPVIEKAVAEKTELPAGAVLAQVPTPPVRLSYSISCRRCGRSLALSRNPLPPHLRTRLQTRIRLCLCPPHSSLVLSFTPSRLTLYYYRRTQCSSTFT